jgi:hypothetical protein
LAWFWFAFEQLCKVIVMSLTIQLIYLFVIALPVACISWTVTHEEIFKEPRKFCELNSRKNKSFVGRKFFYILTCEYCFSHYVTIVVLIITRYYLLFSDWRGYIIAGFSIVWIANIYMSLFYLLRQGIKKEKVIIEEIVEENKRQN